MKRLFVTLIIAISFIGFSSFDSSDVTPAALKSFKSSFSNAKEVEWTKSESLFKANFTLNGQYIAAYYDTDGNMVAITRHISSLQLPIGLQTSLKKNFERYWISDLFEIANEGGTSYYITLENADTKLVLKSYMNSDWQHYKKQRKS